MTSSRAWSALTLLAGIALATGYAAGRRASGPGTTAPARADVADDLVTARLDELGAPAVREHRGGTGLAGALPRDNRLRPDVLLGPVLLVMIGVIVDRLRESDAGESATAWLLILGATVGALLARSAGYQLAARGFYCFLVVFSWTATALYVESESGTVPQSWVSSTLTGSLLWLAADLRERLRHRPPGHKGRAVLVACENWLGFFVAWAVLAQLVYIYVARFVADPGQHSVLGWLSVVLVVVLGGAAVVALTVTWPRRRAGAAVGRSAGKR